MNNFNIAVNSKSFEYFAEEVIKKYGRGVQLKCYSEFDELADLEILRNAMDKGYKKLLYVIRSAGTNLLAFEQFIPEWYITARGDYKNFNYILIDLHAGISNEITCSSAFELINRHIEPPYPLSQSVSDYFDWIKDDLRYRGFPSSIDIKSLKQMMDEAQAEKCSVLVHYLEKVHKNITSISNVAF